MHAHHVFGALAAFCDLGNGQSRRVRGKNANWRTVIENLEKLRDMKTRKDFRFTLSMTLNTVNTGEIEQFVDLALSYGAEPLIMLVANPYQEINFQRKFLIFTPTQFDDMFGAIERSLPKVRAQGFEDAEIYLNQLRRVLLQHRDTDNNPTRFKAKNVARKAFHVLPEPLQIPIRKVVQRVRTRRFGSYDN